MRTATRYVTRLALAVSGALCAALLHAPATNAQAPTAEVRTWSGQDVVMSEPVIDTHYTVIIQKDTAGTAPVAEGVSAAAPLEIRGSVRALSNYLQPDIVSRWGRRPVNEVRVQKDGVETRVPLDGIRSLLFTRQLVTRNTLPVYHAPRHFRHAVTVIFQDGSKLEGDYVNLGTAVLTGTTAQGRVEIPWEEIELLRFGTR